MGRLSDLEVLLHRFSSSFHPKTDFDQMAGHHIQKRAGREIWQTGTEKADVINLAIIMCFQMYIIYAIMDNRYQDKYQDGLVAWHTRGKNTDSVIK